MSDRSTLLIVLGSVFAFILLVFVLMVSCFTWRKRRAHSNARGEHDRIVETRLAARMKEFPRTSTRQSDRWTRSTKTGGMRDSTEVDEEGRRRLTDKDAQVGDEDIENPFTDEHANGTEWGATVNEDGTRSYLNGWFALDRPTITINSFSSHGSASKGRHRRVDSEWELDSESDNDKTDAMHNPSYDAEAYRPPHER